jgi:hypothetical protein
VDNPGEKPAEMLGIALGTVQFARCQKFVQLYTALILRLIVPVRTISVNLLLIIGEACGRLALFYVSAVQMGVLICTCNSAAYLILNP